MQKEGKLEYRPRELAIAGTPPKFDEVDEVDGDIVSFVRYLFDPLPSPGTVGSQHQEIST